MADSESGLLYKMSSRVHSIHYLDHAIKDINVSSVFVGFKMIS